MRRLTLTEVREKYGGILPHDAVLRPDDEPETPPSPSTSPAKTKTRGRPRSERFAVLNAFVDFELARLTGAEAKIWLILFRDTKATGTARTGQADIARRAGLTVRGAQKAIARLQAKGFIRIVHRGRLNGGPSSYRVHPTGAHDEP